MFRSQQKAGTSMTDTIYSSFLERVRETPDAIAVIDER